MGSGANRSFYGQNSNHNLETPPLEKRFDTFKDYNDNNNNSMMLGLNTNSDPTPRIISYTNEEYPQYNSLRDGTESTGAGDVYSNNQVELYDNVDRQLLQNNQNNNPHNNSDDKVQFSKQYAPV